MNRFQNLLSMSTSAATTREGGAGEGGCGVGSGDGGSDGGSDDGGGVGSGDGGGSVCSEGGGGDGGQESPSSSQWGTGPHLPLWVGDNERNSIHACMAGFEAWAYTRPLFGST
jgi:hypothetical protein